MSSYSAPRSRRAGGEAPGEPRRAGRSSSARSRHDRARGLELPMLPIADACDRRRCLGAAGRGPGAVPGAGDAPTQICVPRLRGGGGSGAGARAADQGRPADRGDGRLRAGVQIPWHLPLYRQAQMLAAQKLDIKRSTLAFWVGYAAAELRPVFERLRELILTSGKIAVDETKAPVLDPGRGHVKEGYFWAVARDDRLWGGADPPAIAFAYAPGRGAIHGLKLLDNYAGVVQCDGYAAYKTIAAKAPDRRITLAFCWSHLRRRFFDHAKGEAPIAREALERESPRSTRSRRRSGAQAPTSVAACARRRANRSSWRSGPGSSISWRASRASPGSPTSSTSSSTSGPHRAS